MSDNTQPHTQENRKRHCITVRGENHTWSFPIDVDPQYLDEWLADGLDIAELQGSSIA